MTPIYFNSSSADQYNEHQLFSPRDHHKSPNSQASLSSNSLTCHIFFNSITTHDQDEVCNRDQSLPAQNEHDDVGSQTCDDHCVENHDERGGVDGGLEVSLWKKENLNYDHINNDNQVKWMSSKMRVMLKMKKRDPTKLNTFQSTAKETKLEDHHDHKEQDRENAIKISYSNNTLIRVCSDCNTTKTPLWRSGPQGPKSLCNACGIRQRKARKAMAAAQEAIETGKSVYNERPTSLQATKVLRKDHKKQNKGHVTKYKNKLYSKHINTKASPTRKNTVEEFLVTLSKSLAFHGVFPQDEKEAAILLMALSCGYVHQ